MAKKISELTELTTVNDSDLLHVVDVDDTTMSSSGTNKKATKQNILKEVTQDISDLDSNTVKKTDTDVSGNSWVLDEDDMASDSDEKVPTQQSVKAYVDNHSSGDWNTVTDVIPTRTSADDPTYVIQFAGVDLTSKVSVGQKISWVQNGSTRYGFVTALSVSGGNTDLTLYGGTDYDVDDTSTYAISDVKFSSMKTPYGFPLDPDKWSEITVYTNYLLDTTTTDDTWQELDDSVNLTIPIGKWKVHLSASIAVEFSGGSWQGCTSTLSTTTNSETNPEFTGIIYPYTSGTGWIRDKAHTLDNIIDLTTKTTFYFLVNPQPRNGGSTVNVRYYGNAYPFHIKATIAYL